LRPAAVNNTTGEAQIPVGERDDTDLYLRCKVFGEGVGDQIIAFEYEESDTYGWWGRLVGYCFDSGSLTEITFWSEDWL